MVDMSGLEVLGAVASAAQLADLCLKIATCAVDLFNRIRDAPEMVQKRLEEVKQLTEIARLIERNPSLQTPLIASVLTRARADADQLFKILIKIDVQPVEERWSNIGKRWRELQKRKEYWQYVIGCKKIKLR